MAMYTKTNCRIILTFRNNGGEDMYMFVMILLFSGILYFFLMIVRALHKYLHDKNNK